MITVGQAGVGERKNLQIPQISPSTWLLGRAEKPKMLNINLNQVGSNGTHKNKTYLSKEKNSKVHIRIGKCI